MNERLPSDDAAQAPPTSKAASVPAMGAEQTRSFTPQADTITHGQATHAGEMPSIPGFEIRAVLGHGGMGVVYQAWQFSLKRHVALKMILAGEHAGAQHLARFRTEAQAVAQLQHPNIVQIYEIGEHQGRPFLCLEYVDGGSLAAKLNHQPQPAEGSARFVELLARAMHYTHEHGIVHRDLKPANVLLSGRVLSGGVLSGGVLSGGVLSGDGSGASHHSPLTTQQPKITDFGLAKQLQDDSGQTMSGAVMGTPSYMAPEQASGKTHEIGPLADVYALGGILYEMLTGRQPFHGDTHVETLRQVMHDEPIPPRKLQPSVPRDLETICLKAMAKEPGRRYPSALALAQDLERFGTGEPILAQREGPVRRLWRKVRRRPLAYASLLALVLAVVAAGFFAWEFSHARNIRTISKNINERLQERVSSRANLEEMEALIAELKPLAAEEAASARRNLYQRFADCLIEDLRQPQLGELELARIENANREDLAPRAPELADMVGREITAAKLAGIKKALDARLPNVEFTAAYLDELEKLIATIEPLNPGYAREARADLSGRYEKLVRNDLRPDRALTLEDFAKIRADVDLLKTRHPGLHATLHKLVVKREGVLQTVLVVEPPFDNAFATVKVKPAAKTAFLPSPLRGNSDLPVVLLGDACRGDVQMEVTFAYPSWGTANQLGLSLNTGADRKRGYAFIVGLAPASRGPFDAEEGSKKQELPTTLESARMMPGTINLKIQRNGVTLRQETLKATLPAKALTLRATREGSFLTFELLQDKAPVSKSIRFQDVFASSSTASGVFALRWPQGVGLESLRLRRQTLPPVPGPLQTADHLLAEGKINDALALFQDQSLDSRHSAELRQEARCKEALCLLELKNTDKAAELLSELVRELDAKGERWPLLAACELWLLYLRQNKRAEADDLADTLVAQGFKHEQLATVISDDVRSAIFSYVNEEFSPYNFLLHNSDKRLRSLERMIELHDYLQGTEVAKPFFRWQLARAYRIVGQNGKAQAVLEKWLREYGVAGEYDIRLLEELGWVYRDLGQPERGLEAIRNHLRNVPQKHAAFINRGWIELARLHVAMGNWQEAERELDKYFEAAKTHREEYQPFVAACLMRGFLRRQRKDEAGAQAAWNTKFIVPDGKGVKSYSLTDPAIVAGGGIPVLHALVLASLTNQLTDDQARHFQDRLLSGLPPDYRTVATATGFRLSTPLLRDVWRTPRGLEAARHLAYHDLPFNDHLKLPVLVVSSALMRQDGMPAGEISAEQDELIWRLSEEVWAGLRTGKLTQGNMVQMALSWKGTTNFLGWGGLSRALEKQPGLRGPLAYVMGQRLLRLGQPPERAIELFRTAQADAPADSALRRLAEAELRRLKAK
jgi:serine/threonine protein kinase